MTERITHTVVAETVGNSGEAYMISCIGAYTDYEKAYGAALLYLDEMAEGYCDRDKEELLITTLIQLEGETGWGLYLKDKDGNHLYRTYILEVVGGGRSEKYGGD